MTSNIVSFRQVGKNRTTCVSCGIPFNRERPAHTLCRRCFWWGRTAWRMSQMREAIREAVREAEV